MQFPGSALSLVGLFGQTGRYRSILGDTGGRTQSIQAIARHQERQLGHTIHAHHGPAHAASFRLLQQGHRGRSVGLQGPQQHAHQGRHYAVGAEAWHAHPQRTQRAVAAADSGPAGRDPGEQGRDFRRPLRIERS